MKSHYLPTRDPHSGLLGHFEGRTGQREDPDGVDFYDVFVQHCQAHPTEQPPCDRCAEMEYRPTTEGPDATRPG